jgi:hypothetical protein
MKAPQRSRVPQVNLLTAPRRALHLSLPSRLTEIGLVVLLVLIWGGVAVAVATLLGWHPHLGLGP